MGPADQAKIFDINKPHKVAPSASSRPLIVGHHPLMPDPMVLEQREQFPKINIQEPLTLAPSPAPANPEPPKEKMAQPISEPTIIPQIKNHFQDPANSFMRPLAPTSSTPPIISLVALQDQFAPIPPQTAPSNAANAKHHTLWLAITIAIVIVLAVAAGIYLLTNKVSSNSVQSTAILWQ